MILLLLWSCQNAKVHCDAECPEGTNRVEINFEQTIAVGTMAVEGTSQCLAFCEPTHPCVFPNVPEVTEDVFTCSPLEGYNTLPAADDVDTSFGAAWRELPPPAITEPGVRFDLIFIGDVDGDGSEDVVLWGEGDLLTLFSVGDGTFAGPVASGLADGTVKGGAVGDFDADGYADVLLTTRPADNTLQLHRGDGSGVFAAGVEIPIAVSDEDMALTAADIDNDGALDIVLTNYEGAGEYVILFAEAGGDYTEVRLPAAPWGSQQVGVTLGDFNDDAWLDIAAAGAGGTVALNQSGRSFSGYITGADGTDGWPGLFVMDADVDGSDEFVIWDNTETMTVYDVGANGFTALPELSFPSEASGFFGRRGDLDGDGAPDLVGSEGNMLFTNFGAPYAGSRPGGGGPHGGAIDVDGDGLYEALTASGWEEPSILTVVFP